MTQYHRDKSPAFIYTGRIPSAADGRGPSFLEVTPVSIVRVGLAETKKFSEGYDAIFRKKKAEADETAKEKKPAKKSSAKKKTKKK
jgi:hypothetical protein